jgi:hypothetical protein
MPSPITGTSGNIEFLIHAATPSDAGAGPEDATPERDLSALLDAAAAEGESTGSRR